MDYVRAVHLMLVDLNQDLADEIQRKSGITKVVLM